MEIEPTDGGLLDARQRCSNGDKRGGVVRAAEAVRRQQGGVSDGSAVAAAAEQRQQRGSGAAMAGSIAALSAAQGRR
jgi:hypothetical protein